MLETARYLWLVLQIEQAVGQSHLRQGIEMDVASVVIPGQLPDRGASRFSPELCSGRVEQSGLTFLSEPAESSRCEKLLGSFTHTWGFHTVVDPVSASSPNTRN